MALLCVCRVSGSARFETSPAAAPARWAEQALSSRGLSFRDLHRRPSGLRLTLYRVLLATALGGTALHAQDEPKPTPQRLPNGDIFLPGDIHLPSDIQLPMDPLHQLQADLRAADPLTPEGRKFREDAMRRLSTLQGFAPALEQFLSRPETHAANPGFTGLRAWKNPEDILAILPAVWSDDRLTIQKRADAVRLGQQLGRVLEREDAAYLMGLREGARTLWMEKGWLSIAGTAHNEDVLLREWGTLAPLIDRSEERAILWAPVKTLRRTMGRGFEALNYDGVLVLPQEIQDFMLAAHEMTHSFYRRIPLEQRQRFEAAHAKAPRALAALGFEAFPNAEMPEEFFGYVVGLWMYHPDALFMLQDTAPSPSITAAVELAAEEVFTLPNAPGPRRIRFYTPSGFPDPRSFAAELPIMGRPLTFAELQLLFDRVWPYSAVGSGPLPDRDIVQRVLGILYRNPVNAPVFPSLPWSVNTIAHPVRPRFVASLARVNRMVATRTGVRPDQAAYEFLARNIELSRLAPSFWKSWLVIWAEVAPGRSKDALPALRDSLRAIPADPGALAQPYRPLAPAIGRLKKLLSRSA